MLYAVTLTDPGQASADSFILTEDDGSNHRAAWIPLTVIRTGKTRLFPSGLLDLL